MPKQPNQPATETPAPADADLAGLDFEAAVRELEELVARMEGGNLSLEDSLRAFERGVKLTRHCQSALRNAELAVKQLTESDTLEPFDADAADDN
jgi:exodeoxyribonuclease VII small subunit